MALVSFVKPALHRCSKWPKGYLDRGPWRFRQANSLADRAVPGAQRPHPFGPEMGRNMHQRSRKSRPETSLRTFFFGQWLNTCRNKEFGEKVAECIEGALSLWAVHGECLTIHSHVPLGFALEFTRCPKGSRVARQRVSKSESPRLDLLRRTPQGIKSWTKGLPIWG